MSSAMAFRTSCLSRYQHAKRLARIGRNRTSRCTCSAGLMRTFAEPKRRVMQTPEQVIVQAIRYTHRLGEEARRIIGALEDAGYAIVRNAPERKADLPAILDVYSPAASNTSMFAGAQ